MSEQTPFNNNKPTLKHLQEINIDATELVAPVTSWLSLHEDLWRTAKHAGLEEVPKDALEAATVRSLGRKILAALPGQNKTFQAWILYRSQVEIPSAVQVAIQGREVILVPISKPRPGSSPSSYANRGNNTLDYPDLSFGKAYFCRHDTPAFIAPGVSFFVFVLAEASNSSG